MTRTTGSVLARFTGTSICGNCGGICMVCLPE
jgi:hypothetical protein